MTLEREHSAVAGWSWLEVARIRVRNGQDRSPVTRFHIWLVKDVDMWIASDRPWAKAMRCEDLPRRCMICLSCPTPVEDQLQGILRGADHSRGIGGSHSSQSDQGLEHLELYQILFPYIMVLSFQYPVEFHIIVHLIFDFFCKKDIFIIYDCGVRESYDSSWKPHWIVGENCRS